MKKTLLALLLAASLPAIAAPPAPSASPRPPTAPLQGGPSVVRPTPYTGKYPYRKFHLSDRDAAAHLLSRLTFGQRPGDLEEIQRIGIDRWFEGQLAASDGDGDLNRRLKIYPELAMSDREIQRVYLQGDQIERRAHDELAIPARPADAAPEAEKKAYRAAIDAYKKTSGLHDVGELYPDMVGQKLLRAVYSRNQVAEVMTDFWFNHFNVAWDSDARNYLTSYERDVIRPLALGHFKHLLLGTAKHPAMLGYLSNARSVANSNQPTALELDTEKVNMGKHNAKVGLNENYGREVMELHTLGVDGGYTQHDVTEMARALTGWTIFPMAPNQDKYRQALEDNKIQGATIQGDFLYRADQHDSGVKIVLGRKFGPGGGLSEGEAALTMLTTRPQTAHFVCKKLAVRFVSDHPPAELVDRMAAEFLHTNGDTRSVLRTMVQSPEFWAPASREAKVKTPFELLASSMRALNAEVEQTGQVYYWLDRMGQPVYRYPAPTGFPDRAQHWVGSGTLTYRMNYGVSLATNHMNGVKVDLRSFQHGAEPPEEQVKRVARMLLPGHDLHATVHDLIGLLPKAGELARQAGKGDAPQLNLVVGLVIGSPEFQRR